MILGNMKITIKCVDNFSKPLFETMKTTFFFGLPKWVKDSVLEAFEETP